MPGYASVPAAPHRAVGPSDHAAVLAPREGARVAPDYDGREDEATVGDVALWVPRVALFPAYLATEYLVRRPLGALTVAVEQEDVVGKLEDVFTFGPENNIALVPSGFLEFGFHPAVGAYFSWDDFLARGNDLRASVSTGGERWWRGLVADRVELGEGNFLQAEVDAVDRPDLLFWGVGPRTLDRDEGSYELQTVGGGLRIHAELGRKGNFFEAWTLARARAFSNGECGGGLVVEEAGAAPRFACGDPTILEQLSAGRYPSPPGFEGYAALKTGARVVLDSREPRPAPGSGVAVDLSVENGGQISGRDNGGWLSWGGTAAGFLDLTRTQRVLSLSVTTRFAEPLADGFDIPFTELVGASRVDDVPDGELLHGFRPGRLLGQSAAVAALEYRWPVWTFLDGVLQTGIGNTFGPHLEDFAPELLRYSFAGGLRSTNHRDHSFNLLLGFGTETFDQGADLTSVRFLFGGTTGF